MFYFVFLPMAVDDGQKDRDIFCHLENVGDEANLKCNNANSLQF